MGAYYFIFVCVFIIDLKGDFMKRFISLFMILTIFLCLFLQGCDLNDIGDAISPNKKLTAEEIYDLVSSSVVEITGERINGTSTGTGFFYDKEGTVVTNYHVIEGCVSATITLSNGKSYDVDKILKYDIDRDIAILVTKCESSKPLKIREKEVKTGEAVYAIGSSLGLSGSLSDGIVSSAEREVNGQIYIQITAPISHGNSGGPLLDQSGQVVGIVSAFISEGQNLNLAIPINDIKKLPVQNPINIESFFEVVSNRVEWISDYRFQYYEKESTYVLLYQLSDINKNPTYADGTVKVKIVNDDGVTVYNKEHSFSKNDFQEWIYDDVNEMYLATIYISPTSIEKGSTEKGTVYFTVYGKNYSFDECSIKVFDLPAKSISIQLPQLPLTINSYGYYSSEIHTTWYINSITYKKEYEDSLYIYFSGEKVYDVNGNDNDSSISIEWKLYDSEDYLIDRGTFYTESICVGDKFRDRYVFVADGIKAGENYRLVIVDTE